MHPDEHLHRLASRQHGVVGWHQARALGLTPKVLHARIARGDWLQPSTRVLRRSGSTRTFPQRCIEGVLDAGPQALASCDAAAALQGLPGFQGAEVHVSRQRDVSGRSAELAVLHRPRHLPAHHATSVDGVPVTTVARTLFDLAGCCHPGRVERALDSALSRKLVTLEQVRRTTVELLRRGRAGSALMRELLAERGAGYVPPAGGLEAAFYELLVEAGMPLPERQVDLGGPDGWVGRVDFYWRDRRLVIEVDGETWHTSLLDRQADARRDAALRSAGFEVLRVHEEQLRRRPDEVLAAVRRARASPAA